MLTIETIIGPSKIHGTGLFTVFDIKKGRKIWVLDDILDMHIQAEHLIQNPKYRTGLWNKRATDYIKKYAYLDESGYWILCGDDARFMNHSLSPNLITRYEADYAVRDIKSGEELTIDYSTFDLDYKRKLKGFLS